MGEINGIVFDLHGVVLKEFNKQKVRQKVFEKCGNIKGLRLLICYKLGVQKNWVKKHIANIVQEQAKQTHFIKGSDAAIEYFTSLDGYKTGVCSNGGIGSDNADLENHYRNMSLGMNRIETYDLLEPGQSKVCAYRKCQMNLNGVLYVVDDTPKNLYDAQKCGAIPVFISKNKRKIKKMNDKPSILCFPDLTSFMMHIEEKERIKQRNIDRWRGA